MIEKLGSRRAELVTMMPPEKGYSRMEFKIPSRGLIGYRSEFLTDTKGNGIMNSIIADLSRGRVIRDTQPWCPDRLGKR